MHIFEGDLRNSLILKNVFNQAEQIDKKIDGVIHFAGLKSVKESVEKPILYWDANVTSTINLLNVMSSFPIVIQLFLVVVQLYMAVQEKS